MRPQYRAEARLALARAKERLEAGHLRYAALELRLSIEALTYDRAQSYSDELPPTGKWQPKQVMDALLAIDPYAGSSYTLRIGEEPSPGEPPKAMKELGSEVVFGLKQIKKHYQALSSLIHMPTADDVAAGKKWNEDKARERIETVIEALEASLASPVFNSTFGEFSNFDCLRCGQPIKRRVHPNETDLRASCIHCNAPYIGKASAPKSVQWWPDAEYPPCSTPGCEGELEVWRDQIKVGTELVCSQCHKRQVLVLGISPMPPHGRAEN